MITIIIATVALTLSIVSLLAVWKVAQYMTTAEQFNANSFESMMRLVLYIGRETDTLRPGTDPNAIPPNTTIH